MRHRGERRVLKKAQHTPQKSLSREREPLEPHGGARARERDARDMHPRSPRDPSLPNQCPRPRERRESRESARASPRPTTQCSLHSIDFLFFTYFYFSERVCVRKNKKDSGKP